MPVMHSDSLIKAKVLYSSPKEKLHRNNVFLRHGGPVEGPPEPPPTITVLYCIEEFKGVVPNWFPIMPRDAKVSRTTVREVLFFFPVRKVKISSITTDTF